MRAPSTIQSMALAFQTGSNAHQLVAIGWPRLPPHQKSETAKKIQPSSTRQTRHIAHHIRACVASKPWLLRCGSRLAQDGWDPKQDEVQSPPFPSGTVPQKHDSSAREPVTDGVSMRSPDPLPLQYLGNLGDGNGVQHRRAVAALPCTRFDSREMQACSNRAAFRLLWSGSRPELYKRWLDKVASA